MLPRSGCARCLASAKRRSPRSSSCARGRSGPCGERCWRGRCSLRVDLLGLALQAHASKVRQPMIGKRGSGIMPKVLCAQRKTSGGSAPKQTNVDLNRRQPNAACDRTTPRGSHLILLQGSADSLLLGVEIKGVVSHFTSPARLLVAAKGQRRIKDVVAVDPDRARFQLSCE
jgi:hypothetical protein